MENNEDEFLVFLKAAKQTCKTKVDLRNKLANEINTAIAESKTCPTFQKEHYIKNLNDLKFCMKNKAFSEPTQYRDDILSVLDLFDKI